MNAYAICFLKTWPWSSRLIRSIDPAEEKPRTKLCAISDVARDRTPGFGVGVLGNRMSVGLRNHAGDCKRHRRRQAADECRLDAGLGCRDTREAPFNEPEDEQRKRSN